MSSIPAPAPMLPPPPQDSDFADLAVDGDDSAGREPARAHSESAATGDTYKARDSTSDDSRQAGTSLPLPEFVGRFRILEKLGEGGMGAVYRAWDTSGETEVALKVPHTSPEDDPRGLKRFLREGRVLAALEHPNLCRIHEVGEFEGTRYIAMEYVAGAKLSEFCGPDDPVEPGQAAATVRVLARAMAAAHARDIVHRDLKPSNVIVDPELRLVVVDFGLALALDSESGESRLTSAGSLIGTPAYMSPEQARGDVAAMGPQCDVYAAGVILYELLTGRPPFDGPYVSLIAQILTSEPPAPSSIHEWIDPELDAICARAMAKRTHDRFASMEAFDQALTQYLGDEPEAAPIGTGTPVASPDSSLSAVRRRTRAEDSLRMRRPAASGFGDSVEQLAIWVGGVALLGTAITLFVLWLRTLD